MVMHLKTCCCGCSLKTGSVIIGVLAAIYALGVLVIAILAASAGSGELQKELARELSKYKSTYGEKPQYEESGLDDAINALNNAPTSKTVLAISICTAIISGIYLILSILLLFGASAERARLIKPWIVYAILHLVVYSILALVNVITIFMQGHATSGVLNLVFLAVFVVLEVYFILIVNSFHTELISANFQNKI